MAAIRSMTGFGRSEIITDDYRVLVEIKSVNHRYLDLSIKMPRKFNALEAKLRTLLKKYIERGKTDVFVSFDDFTEKGKRLIYNKEIAAEYVKYIREMSESFELRDDVSAVALARFPDVLMSEDMGDDEERYKDILEKAFTEAAENFVKDREREGEHLKADLLDKLGDMEGYVRDIVEFSPSVVDDYRERLYAKIREILGNSDITADEGRVVTEVAVYADKICTDEEMVRLKTHIASMKAKLIAGGSCGRELDFLAQEMNREANTTLSKANNLKIADTAIALKTDIEKIREQVQNIE
ncbi:MAG: YicC/YloC family endoribonuclease [Eubacteriales bacterium]|nr:YicC/YloC family endoribonuclease [Eubacteriales bacterium]